MLVAGSGGESPGRSQAREGDSYRSSVFLSDWSVGVRERDDFRCWINSSGAQGFWSGGQEFLEALVGSTISDACAACSISRTTAYAWRKDDTPFAEAWDEIAEATTDLIEKEAVRIATEGTLEPVLYKGDECGTIRRAYPGLIQFLLERRRRATYGRHDTVDDNVDDKRAVLVVEKPAEDADEWAEANRLSGSQN